MEVEEETGLEDVEAGARAVKEFERVQAGLGVRGGGERIVGRRDGKVVVEAAVEGGSKGVKRKFEVDEDELVRLGREGQDKHRRRSSQQNGGNADLPSFWVPSKIPDNHRADVKAVKQQPTCPAASADKPHDFTLKTLMTVHFTEDKPNNSSEPTTPTRTCPSCNKALSNSSKAVLSKPCGHVLCKPCSDKFQTQVAKSAHDDDGERDGTVRCHVCSEDVTPGRKVKGKGKKDGSAGDEKAKEKEKEGKIERGLVELSSEGTGFAGGGGNMVKKQGLAFQC